MEERRRPSHTHATGSGKRKASSPADESDDGLQRAVKKLIRQAQLEADSPTSGSGTGTGSGHGQGGTPGEMPSLSRSSSKERPVFDAYPMPQVGRGVGQSSPNKAGVKLNNKEGGQANQRSTGPSTSTSNQPMGQNMFAPPVPQSNPPQAQNQNQNLGAFDQNMLFPPADPANPNIFDSNNFNFNFQPSPSSFGASYNFPTDPHGSLDFFPSSQGQPLDPAVESMLASYFPGPQTAQQQSNPTAAGGVGAEDFLSRVFSFGWNDPAAGAQQGQGQGQGGGDPGTGTGNGNGNTNSMSGYGTEVWGPGAGWMA